METYFATQAAALQAVEERVNSTGRWEIEYPDKIWTEHVAYGKTVRYTLPLRVKSTGNPARKALHITLYRMDSGNYELTHYLA
jgi:hypothetical protein